MSQGGGGGGGSDPCATIQPGCMCPASAPIFDGRSGVCVKAELCDTKTKTTVSARSTTVDPLKRSTSDDGLGSGAVVVTVLVVLGCICGTIFLLRRKYAEARAENDGGRDVPAFMVSNPMYDISDRSARSACLWLL